MKNYHQDNQSTEAKNKIFEIAYFSAEYALSSTLPIYAGGLGVLAGDYIREARDQKFSLVAVGIRYKKAQSMLTTIGDEGEKEIITQVKDKNHKDIRVSFLIQGKEVFATAYRWNEYEHLYLLDTDVPENDDDDKKITESLYTDDREKRFKQEIVLGIGGFELLRKLEIRPKIFHLNEGHSAFLSLALIQQKMKESRIDFRSAKELARQEVIFTNHTLILEGQEMFSRESFENLLSSYPKDLGVDISDLWGMGCTKDGKLFSMTNFAFRTSCGSNAVSEIHAEKARVLWPEDHPTAVVTNGIYIPRWGRINSPSQGSGVTLWDQHLNNKRELLKYIFEQTGVKWDENVLLLGWGRRFVEYKQPLLLFQDISKLKSMMTGDKPLRIVYSGPTGTVMDSNPLVAKLRKLISEHFKDLVVFLPNYNTHVSELMTAGCDVWLNTPVVGREACGTSGMKAGLNGTLNFSTRDGWVAEVDMEKIGWVVDEPDVNYKMLEILRTEIVPMFYEQKDKWKEKMNNSRNLILKQFSATRMLKDYIEKLYNPILKK